MEALLAIVLDMVSLCLALVTILAAVTIGFGEVKALRHPVARIVLTIFLAILGLWILEHGIKHMVSG
jgi:hypothetical protein